MRIFAFFAAILSGWFGINNTLYIFNLPTGMVSVGQWLVSLGLTGLALAFLHYALNPKKP
ncbi:MAG: hypothetical protein NTW85_01650 [Methylococcales bacterium]|nr:hypothetical protein [Methylococcales bacterium]